MSLQKKNPDRSGIGKRAVNLFYPKRCFMCRDLIDPEDNQALLRYSGMGLCPSCSAEPYRIKYASPDRAAACFLYEGNLRRAVFDLKYNGRKSYGRYFAALMLEDEKMRDYLRSFDVLCPVPISPQRMKSRGYNQAALLTEGLCALLDTRFEDLLVRKKDTKALKGLDKNERVRMLSGAFDCSARYLDMLNSGSIPGKILIVDDIATTGTTLEKCRQALLSPFEAGLANAGGQFMDETAFMAAPEIHSLAFCTEYEDNT